MGKMEIAIDNLAFAATNDKAVVQQLTAANLALTTTVATLTAANNKFIKAAAKKGTGPTLLTSGKTPGKNAPYPRNYCWTHGHRVSKLHTSETCTRKAEGHVNDATAADTKGGSKQNKGWDKA
jgi:hypothetical protein